MLLLSPIGEEIVVAPVDNHPEAVVATSFEMRPWTSFANWSRNAIEWE